MSKNSSIGDASLCLKNDELFESNSIDESDMIPAEDANILWEDCLRNEAYISKLKDILDNIDANFNGIADIEDFKYRLRQDNLLTPELEDFMGYYMRYRNKDFLKELLPDEF